MLEIKLSNVESAVGSVKAMVENLDTTVSTMAEKNNDRLIQWGVALIAVLAGVCGWLLSLYIAP
jgi:hypothetical protein